MLMRALPVEIARSLPYSRMYLKERQSNVKNVFLNRFHPALTSYARSR